MTKDEERKVGQIVVHHWAVTSLIYTMNERLQLAKTIQDVLRVCAEFAASSTNADGSLVCIHRGEPDGKPLVVTTGDKAPAAAPLLQPDHPFYQRVLNAGSSWQAHDLDDEQRHRLALAQTHACAVLAVPIKRGEGQILGGILVWKTQSATCFDSREADRLQLCASQAGLVIENLSLHLVEEKMAVWETLSRGMAFEIHNPITLLGIWLGELERDAAKQWGPDYAEDIRSRFLSKMKAILKEADAATREFLFDFDVNAASNRALVEAKALIEESLADIPNWEGKVDLRGQEVRVFINRRRLRAALRDIAQHAIAHLPAREKLRIEVTASGYEGLAARIVYSFPVPRADETDPKASIFLFREDELIEGLIRIDKGRFQEQTDAGRHEITVSLPCDEV